MPYTREKSALASLQTGGVPHPGQAARLGYNLGMAEIQVRAATAEDLPPLAAFDHGYSTDYVWQMDLRDDPGIGQVQATFRSVRLPRPMRVAVPRGSEHLTDAWNRRVCFLVAEQDGALKGYLNLVLAAARLWSGGSEREALTLLTADAGSGLCLDPETAHWGGLSLSAAEIARARQEFVCSIGSCSFTEPLGEIVALGLDPQAVEPAPFARSTA